MLDLDPFGSPGVNGDAINGGNRDGLDVISGRFGDFVQVEGDRHNLMVIGMGVIGQFLVEVLMVKFIGSFVEDDIDGIGG